MLMTPETDRHSSRSPKWYSKSLVVALTVIAVCGLVLAALLSALDAELQPQNVGYRIVLSFDIVLMLYLAVITAAVALGFRSFRNRANNRNADSETSTNFSLVQLLQDKEAAESANAAKSRYLANVSHEIRAPLNSIYGYAQLVERGGKVSPKEAAKIIRQSAEHLTNLVEGLLDISQVENGVIHVNNDPVRLHAFIDQLASMMRPMATQKGLTFQYTLPDRLPEFVRADQKRLRQILINLLSNAIKFTSTGSVELRLSYSGQMAVFEVKDTGPGISSEDAERIFAPFERGNNSYTRSQHGVGLGLPITKALVQILGGNLEMDSVVGAGTTFRVTLMLPNVAGHMLETTPRRRAAGYTGERRSILAVDDDVHQLALMRNLLESLGFEVTIAVDGELAVDLAKTNAFDLAILDISMPGISGWETANRLRADHGARLKIMMLSANAHELNRSQGQQTAHDLFLVKPVEIEGLIEAIGSQLSLNWIWEDMTGSAPLAEDAATQQVDLPEETSGHIEEIRNLLRIGHVRGIEAAIKRLGEAAPEAGPFVARLYECLDRFDLASLAKQLDTVRGKSHA
jgi:signal transduction histidine kinase/CheY-like chemotaxis protein